MGGRDVELMRGAMMMGLLPDEASAWLVWVVLATLLGLAAAVLTILVQIKKLSEGGKPKEVQLLDDLVRRRELNELREWVKDIDGDLKTGNASILTAIEKSEERTATRIDALASGSHESIEKIWGRVTADSERLARLEAGAPGGPLKRRSGPGS